jgi:mono/diheme cytochrome c family protein
MYQTLNCCFCPGLRGGFISASSALRLLPALALLLLSMALLGGAPRHALAAESVLEIFDGARSQKLSRTQLLAHAATREITIEADAAYHKTMQFKAIPLKILLPQITKTESLQFVALDGFVANIPGVLLAGPGQAFIAIEPESVLWPALKKGTAASAGPFYLVWLTPEKSVISSEQWPYQIAKIAVAAPLPQRYPQLMPPEGGNAQALRGLQVYVANCAVCHQLNGGGDASIGPDLNRPYSPVEYFHEKYLRKLIRNPASVRTWKASLMPGFTSKMISDDSLDDLLAYFRVMAAQH